MWREIGGNLFSLVVEKVGRYILPKTRWRVAYRKRLKIIMERFSDCLEYNKTCSLITLIGETERKVSNSSLSIQRKKAEMLREWFVFLKGRVDSTYLKNTKDLLNEFAFIVTRVHDIFRDLYKVLDKQDQQMIQQMKKDEYGYPTFKKIYNETTNELEKLYQEASEKLKEIETRSFLALPEL